MNQLDQLSQVDQFGEPVREEGPRKLATPRRGFWLTSLIVGASIFTWLTMAGTVAGVVYIAAHGDGSGNSIIDNGAQSYKDKDGYKCDYFDTDLNDRCPTNPNFQG